MAGALATDHIMAGVAKNIQAAVVVNSIEPGGDVIFSCRGMLNISNLNSRGGALLAGSDFGGVVYFVSPC